MASQRLRPGTWSLVKSATATERIYIDNELFEMYSGQTMDFDVRIMCRYDDTNITAYRKPPTPQTAVSNVGDIPTERTKRSPRSSVSRSGSFLGK